MRLPLIGPFLRWRHARAALQMTLAVLAVAMIVDGLTGPQIASMNLAGVLPWIHWRGLLMLSLLVLGNVFCLACPFTLPRRLARRWLSEGRAWPRWLRNKWLAVALLIIFLWAYEALALWDRPAWTALIAMGYFAAAFVVDSWFRDGDFCKYICPIGQFNFVQSLVSPWEVKVREPKTCLACRTHDCIRGHDSIPGCELHLFQPRKTGNMDCTFCLDCVHACPQQNVGILFTPPGQDLLRDPFRSGIGRFSERADLAALVVVLVFGAFANAAGMVAPVVALLDRWQAAWNIGSRLPVVSIFYLLALIACPAILIGAAATASCIWGRFTVSPLQCAIRGSYALIPLGFSMWLAHYSFHLLTSYDVVVPATQRFVAGLGWSLADEPHWIASCCRAPTDWLPRLEVLCLGIGLLGSLYTAYRVALMQAARGIGFVMRTCLPWGLLILLLYAFGVWVVCQPMEMRGTMMGAG